MAYILFKQDVGVPIIWFKNSSKWNSNIPIFIFLLNFLTLSSSALKFNIYSFNWVWSASASSLLKLIFEN